MATKEAPFRLSLACSATKHGTANAYTAYRCRCATAREAWRLYNKRRREGRNIPNCVDSTGSTRRMRALVALGWNFRAIARKAGCHHRTVQDVAYARRAVITRHTARWVSDLYNELSTVRPEGWVADRCRNLAANKGWLPPLAWDDATIDDPAAQPDLGDPDAEVVDEVAVRRALAGDRVRLTPTEREQAMRDGLDAGLTVTEIGRRLGLSGHTAKELAKHVRTAQAA